MRLRTPAAILTASLLSALTLAAASGGIAAAAPVSSPWAQTNYNAAQSRANLSETTLTVRTVPRVRFRRSVQA